VHIGDVIVKWKMFVVPDLQVPFEDRAFVDAMCRAIDYFKQDGDRVLTIGDEMDMQTISRWSDGTPTSYERSIGRDRDRTVEVLRDLQVTDTLRSNHTDRLFNTVMRKAPGLMGLPELELEQFMRLPELGITFHKEGYRFAEGWAAFHGDESGLSQIAGQTARTLSAKTGLSVVIGHTHRLGMQPVTYSANGKVTRTLFGIEVGNAMDMRKALYAKTHNWLQGWAVMHIDGRTVVPELIPVVNRRFIVMGKEFSW
jgi:hypothetical protein